MSDMSISVVRFSACMLSAVAPSVTCAIEESRGAVALRDDCCAVACIIELGILFDVCTVVRCSGALAPPGSVCAVAPPIRLSMFSVLERSSVISKGLFPPLSTVGFTLLLAISWGGASI